MGETDSLPAGRRLSQMIAEHVHACMTGDSALVGRLRGSGRVVVAGWEPFGGSDVAAASGRVSSIGGFVFVVCFTVGFGLLGKLLVMSRQVCKSSGSRFDQVQSAANAIVAGGRVTGSVGSASESGLT
jgi:hypothetical protein